MDILFRDTGDFHMALSDEFDQYHDEQVHNAMPMYGHARKETLHACLKACLDDHECAGVARPATQSSLPAPCAMYASVTHRVPATTAPGNPRNVVYAVKSRVKDPPLPGGDDLHALYSTRNPRDGAMWCTNDFGDAREALARTARDERLPIVRVCPSSHRECRRAAPADKYGKCAVPGGDV